MLAAALAVLAQLYRMWHWSSCCRQRASKIRPDQLERLTDNCVDAYLPSACVPMLLYAVCPPRQRKSLPYYWGCQASASAQA